jgi:hypothetical protein
MEFSFEYDQKLLTRIQITLIRPDTGFLDESEVVLLYENGPDGAQRLASIEIMTIPTRFLYDDLGYLIEADRSEAGKTTYFFYRLDKTLESREYFDGNYSSETLFYVTSSGRIEQAYPEGVSTHYSYDDHRLTDIFIFDWSSPGDEHIKYVWTKDDLTLIDDYCSYDAHTEWIIHTIKKLSYTDHKLAEIIEYDDCGNGEEACERLNFQRTIEMTDEGSSCVFEMLGEWVLNNLGFYLYAPFSIPNSDLLSIYGKGDINRFFATKNEADKHQ